MILDTDDEIYKKLLPFIAACAPLGVIINVYLTNNNFVIHADGNEEMLEYWMHYWKSFELYINSLINQFNLNSKTVTMKNDTYALIDLGDMFDLLKSI